MLIAIYLLSNLILIFIPEKKLQKPGCQTSIFLFDTAIISLVIYASEGWNSDLYLIYFLIVFMSGIQMKIWQSFMIGTAASVLYVVIGSDTSWTEKILNTHFLLRFPFFYIVSFFTAYFVQQVREKEQQIQEIQMQII
jgi:K+-sensing histidine kinase KdpD